MTTARIRPTSYLFSCKRNNCVLFCFHQIKLRFAIFNPAHEKAISLLSLSLCIQFTFHTTRWQACYAPLLPMNAPVPRLSLMACGGWCLWVMPQENAFHNLLFLLEKRRKRGEGHKQNKQERRREIERGSGVEGWGEKMSDTGRMLLVKLAWSNLVTGGWGGLLRDTEAENCPLM